MQNNNKYNLVAENSQSTVVSQYTPDAKRATHYQSEAELERAFIQQLETQAYEYLKLTSENDLVLNLRQQLEKLNEVTFSDTEWEHFFVGELANPNQSIEEKTTTIQEDHIKNLTRDDGTIKNIYLIKKDNIHDNSLQVINQYATEDGQRANRYDVTVLVNGLPLVHIELKRRGVAIAEAFNQINRYQRESFWASSGLFEYVQLFVISNGTHTKYYSNTTRSQHIKESNEGGAKKGKRTGNSFEFTSWWADATNQPITDVMDFAKTFFAKHALLNILTRYCVFTTDHLLLVMRPYQIVATERILSRIEVSTNYKKLGTVEAGGYIWHTTGSGKTLTSFKTAQLVSKLPYVDKVVFVVDRKDLDYQTMREYDKFEKGSANSNTSTAILKKQLENPNARIIITTIQKLDRFIGRNNEHAILDGHVVLIFDECHRSQFGDMHAGIIKAFKNYHLFGFTGTPIFAINASSGGRPDLKTTEQAFGEKLHTYTIVDAIADKNVLPFKVDYVSTVREAENIEDKKVSDIDREAVLASPERLANIVGYIREHFDQKTKRNSFYKIKDRRLAGFNSIFAVSSIDVAKKYYAEFKKQLAEVPSDKRLKVATIFSFGVNDEDADGMIDENSEDTSGLDVSSRDFLESAIKDYNTMFGTSYDTSSDKFQNYYKDVSQRVKDREVDVLIVVNMFLTGFDATTLNTLWVDKNLRLHGLLQAFSRTNRILNSVKTFGNIVCFRNLEKATNESIALFGDKEASGIVLLKSYAEYYNGYKDNEKEVRGYASLVAELLEKFPVGQRIVGEQSQKDFIKLYSAILRVRNILTTFDEFAGNEILTERDIQDYHSIYIDLYNDFRKTIEDVKENINDDLVFEMELIKQIEINIDYVLGLIKKYHEDHIKNRELLLDINKAIDSSIELRNKKDLINQFITSLDVHSMVDDDWQKFVDKKKIEELEQIITSENLDHDETVTFIKNAFRDGSIATTGTAITKVLPPVSRFSPTGERTQKRESVIDKLTSFFEKFFDISGGKFYE
ncbi:TPA: DEAD/DEAH box helicase [Candidatus Campbellbacteria bacterium]|nr:MAG: HsdR family type I site-specific deoxyribonuclease, type I restriction enzyme, R subunit [Candidatus Campbellbacteria bacterium GW2011_OD1_34_28]KKP74753.1 MAG: Type I site-specific deoxyribonuclease, HsdR family [Candidatus Campbellbacteria bacterium GW2011_GWD2_35_24]KKP75639.1 MAG: HsdR family type I site-specific deoxyribonuclease, type I restriction enzyme, R subunit [Candidatus Campbellbacteria bacterium GW2011_GWC2_35_28]KKP77113.1 MAG: Type I site-specific deoxyribonuclease, HsdR